MPQKVNVWISIRDPRTGRAVIRVVQPINNTSDAPMSVDDVRNVVRDTLESLATWGIEGAE